MSNSPPDFNHTPAHPTFWQAFWYWLKLGFISFGGPAGQIAMMHQELVEKRRWISEERFLHALNYCMVLPGPEAQQLAVYIGWLLHRTAGGIVAGTLFFLPALFILSALTYIYLAFGDVTLVKGIFNGIKPAVVAIVVFAAWRIGSRALKHPLLWGFAAASFVAIFALHIPFPLIVLLAGIAGFFGGKYAPHVFQSGGGHGASGKTYGKALIDHDTVLPHTAFCLSRLLSLVVIFSGIWLVTIALLPSGTLRDMGLFFSKAAMVTFGGAYAVLPYIYQGGVEHYGWLTATQMMDGLALGETTPGPLVMVTAFIGYVGGWTKALFGAESLALAGFAGASVATFYTFLPSFFFILAGAPLIESTHNDLKFTAPLTGITAAVVGVIVNLAVFFGAHVLFPHGLSGTFEWFYALMSIAAFIALWKYKLDILWVLAASALVGVIYTFLILA